MVAEIKPEEAQLAVVDAGVATIAAQTWPITIKLKYPIDFGRDRYTELVFTRERAQLKVLKGLGIDGNPSVVQLMLIASRLCGVPTAALEMLDLDDSPEVIELALIFFARCLGIGKTP